MLRGKRAALLVTCGGAAGSADLILRAFDRGMRYLGCEAVGKYVVPGCTTPDRLGRKGLETASEMARDILSSTSPGSG